MSEDRPAVDGRSPGDVVAGMVARVLELMPTWTGWNGMPIPSDDRVYTPHKAVRRVADHMLDHLAQINARRSGMSQRPDTWHGSFMTTPSDMATFGEQDVDEARSRLLRLRDLWLMLLDDCDDQALDERPGGDWSVREIAFHVAESVYYAEAVGKL